MNVARPNFSTRELVAASVRSQLLGQAEDLARRGEAALAARRAELASKVEMSARGGRRPARTTVAQDSGG